MNIRIVAAAVVVAVIILAIAYAGMRVPDQGGSSQPSPHALDQSQ